MEGNLDEPNRAWHSMDTDAALSQLGSSAGGLSQAEVEKRTAQFGSNRLPTAKGVGPLRRFLAQFNNLLIQVLLGTAALTALLEHWADTLVTAHQQALETMVDPDHKRIEIQTKVLIGVPFLAIIREVIGNGRDLVIKIPEHRDWLDRLFGSDDMHLLRKCPCPVWLTKSQAQKAYRRVLAAVDVDDAFPPTELQTRRALNRQILEMASSLAISDFAELHVVHAWEAIGEGAMHGAFMDRPEKKIAAYVNQVWKHHAVALGKP